MRFLRIKVQFCAIYVASAKRKNVTDAQARCEGNAAGIGVCLFHLVKDSLVKLFA